MKLFENLDTNDVERTEDRVGSASRLLDSDIYVATIKAAYTGESKSGALSITLMCDIGGKDYTETLYITNKNKEPYFVNSSTRKKQFIPGYNYMNAICLVAAGKELKEVETEEKILSLYNFETQKNENTSVPVLVDLSGKQVALGIIKELRNKAQLVDGKYVDTAESREQNQIMAVFDPESHKTVNEALDGKEATFWDAWLERNKGKVVDRRTIKDAVSNTGSGAATTSAPRKSLFSK